MSAWAVVEVLERPSGGRAAVRLTPVIVSCSELSRRRLGGPGVMMELLLKEHGRSGCGEFSMTVVFRDKRFRRHEEMAAVAKAPVFERFRPGSPGYWAATAAGRLGYARRLWTAVRSGGDGAIVHCHDFVSSYLARRLFGRRRPIVQTVHAKGGAVREIVAEVEALRGSLWERFARHVEWTSVAGADVVVFTSQGARRLFEAEHPRLLEGKDVRVIHAGVDLEELDAVPERPSALAEVGVPADSRLILTVAAQVPDKGLETLVEALALLPADVRAAVRSLIVGRDGPLRGRIESLITERGLTDTVRLVGFLERDALVELMRRAALFMLTPRVSVFDHVLLEVGALGTPVLTTAVGGNLEMFDRESALLVPPEDPRALAEAIGRGLADETLRRRLGDNARERVRGRFSLPALLASYEALYREISERAAG